jgi:C4-dicarboxylate-specific signal transduction histidine kinase
MAAAAPSSHRIGSVPPGAGLRNEQIVIRLLPARTSLTVDADPARLFPELAHERVVSILVEEGSTLHLASDDEARVSESSPAAPVIERLAMMLAALIDNHRALERNLQELRAQVIQSEKLASLGQIAAGIVHELNNPLTTIVAYSDFLRKKTQARGGDPADVERLSRINEAAERIRRFSRDLTDYSRPASEVPAPVAIHDIIERALVFCEHELDKTGVLVERSFGEVRPVRGVAGQLTQVFVNLFTNAAHAMLHEGGLLTISTTMTDDEVQVTITDDGHGIDVDHRAQIFEPFFTTKKDGTGTGLGLSIVRSIVQSHGGRIRVDGAEPRGTVFHVELPTAAAPKSDH